MHRRNCALYIPFNYVVVVSIVVGTKFNKESREMLTRKSSIKKI